MNLRELILRAMTNPTTDVSDPATPGRLPSLPSISVGSPPVEDIYRPVREAMPAMGLGTSSAFSPAQAPLSQQPDSSMVGQIPENQPPQPQLPPQPPPQIQRPRPPQMRRAAPGYDEAAMNELMMQLSQGDQSINEGQNANIGDDSRARALAQVAALRG